MTEKEKQIEEMASFVCSSFHGHHDCENCSLYEERCCVSFCAAKRLYNAGYRKQSEAEWISVEERLPDLYGTYLVYTYDNRIKFGYFHELVIGLPPAFDDYAVTNWMPMPEPPGAKGGE